MKKTKVFSNLAISIDGKIALSNREHFPIGSDADRKQMQVLRKKSDIVVFGASTLRSFKKLCVVNEKNYKGIQPWNGVISSRLDGFEPNWPFFQDQRTKKVLFVSKSTPTKRIKLFTPLADICLLDEETPQNTVAMQIIKYCQKVGKKRILVEGGGGVMWDFIKSDLIDELNVTIVPKVIGGLNAPTLVDGKGFDEFGIKNYKLKSVKKLKNELYLVYSK